jgi:hypothetical protein
MNLDLEASKVYIISFYIFVNKSIWLNLGEFGSRCSLELKKILKFKER